jgi:hypothetical protein
LPPSVEPSVVDLLLTKRDTKVVADISTKVAPTDKRVVPGLKDADLNFSAT